MRTRERGIALLLALLVLLVLILVVGAMSIASRHDRTVAENHLADLQNSYGVRAGYLQASLRLKSDLEKSADVDGPGDAWALPLEVPVGRASVRVATVDVERSLNLAALVDEKGEANPKMAERLRRLVRLLRHPPDTAERILDYVDGDSKGAFEARARNGRFLAPEELLRVEGLTPEVLYGGDVGGDVRKGLLEFVTIWPRTEMELPAGTEGPPPPPPPKEPAPPPPPPPAEGGTPPPPPKPTLAPPTTVNVNTAPAEVLASLSDEMSLPAAEAIVAWRLRPGPDGRPQGFAKVEELKSVPGVTGAVYDSISPALSVKSSIFEIRVRSAIQNIEKAWIYVVRRGSGAKGELTLLSQQRLNDFLSVRPPGEADGSSK